MKYSINLFLLLFCGSCLLAQNVGIGTTTPAYKLDVNGRMRVRTGTLGNNSTSSGIWMEDYRTGINRTFVGMQDSIRVGFYGTGADGIGWGFNFNAVSGDVSIPFGSVGVGTVDPSYDIDIYKPNPSIGFYDADVFQFSGHIEGSARDLYINSYRRPNVFPTTDFPGDIIMQLNTTGPFVGSTAGKVGIGVGTPDAKLHVVNGTEVTETEGGYLQLGFTDNTNLAFDNNEIQVRSNGNAAKLFMQYDGGGIQFGSGDGTVNITSTGEVQRNSVTGSANLLPMAYGKIAANGTILSSTGNFTAQKGVEGAYIITLTDETNLYQNRHNYVILVTPSLQLGLNSQSYIANAGINEDNKVTVYIAKPRIFYYNDSCSSDCGPFSYVQTLVAREAEDNEFSILIYKY